MVIHFIRNWVHQKYQGCSVFPDFYAANLEKCLYFQVIFDINKKGRNYPKWAPLQGMPWLFGAATAHPWIHHWLDLK